MHDDAQSAVHTGCVAISANAARENGIMIYLYSAVQIKKDGNYHPFLLTYWRKKIKFINPDNSAQVGDCREVLRIDNCLSFF